MRRIWRLLRLSVSGNWGTGYRLFFVDGNWPLYGGGNARRWRDGYSTEDDCFGFLDSNGWG